MQKAPVIQEQPCCSLTAGIPTQPEAERLATIFKALGDPTRIKLISLIALAKGQGACICDLVSYVDLAQSTVSHHMKLLADTGLVQREQRGKWAFYKLNTALLEIIGEVVRPRTG